MAPWGHGVVLLVSLPAIADKILKQQAYADEPLATRFVYNLCVATHRFCRVNRLPWPLAGPLKAFNACKREDYPFVTELASRVRLHGLRHRQHKGPTTFPRNVLPASRTYNGCGASRC